MAATPLLFCFSSVEVFVFREEVVEDPEGGLEVEVDDVLGSGLRLRQPCVLHEVKGQADVRRLLVKGLKQYSKIGFTNGLQIFPKYSLATKQTLRCILPPLSVSFSGSLANIFDCC